MKTSIINIKTDPQTKKQAHKIADELGFSLSAVLSAYLKQLVKNKAVYFSTKPQQKPSEWLINELRQAEKDTKQGYVSPTFNTVKNSIAWLKNPKAKYINGKNAN